MKLPTPQLVQTARIAFAMIGLALLWAVPAIALQDSEASPVTAEEHVRPSDKDPGILSKNDVEDDESDPLGLRRLPDEAQDIGVDSQLGKSVNGDLLFHDSENRLVRIGDLFDGKRPVMMSFNYSNCPKLCSVQLENMTMALRRVDFEVGKDFDFVSVSIDPLEQTSRARESKEKYLHLYNKPDSVAGWHFLTGKQKSIVELTDQAGFRYKYVRAQKLYSHPPVFVLFSPEGKIVRYIHGLDYDPATIRLALIESAAGKIGSPINILSYGLGCFSFNESTGKYSFQAISLMRIGGLITVCGLLIGLAPYWFLHRKAGHNQTDHEKHLADPNAV